MNEIVAGSTRVVFEDIAVGDRTDRRSRETAAVRSILDRLYGPGCELGHDACGAPCLPGNPGTSISISHSQSVAAVAVDARRYIGIDTEELRAGQLERIKSRYLSPAEQADWTTPHDLLTAWCIKEAAYKAACAISNGAVAGRPGLDYTRDFVIDRAACTIRIPGTRETPDIVLSYAVIDSSPRSVTVLASAPRR